MEKRSEQRKRITHVNLRRWMREIVLAVALTIAAVTLITVALLRGDSATEDTVPLARKQ